MVTSRTDKTHSSCIQEELPLFAAPSFGDLISDHRLQHVRVIAGRRLRTSWHVTLDPITNTRELTVPSVLLDAPGHVKRALLDWARLPWKPRGKNRGNILRAKRALEQSVWDYFKQQGVRGRKSRPVDPRRFLKQTQGNTWDLGEIFDELNAKYFDRGIASFIRWGAYASTTSYQCTRRDPAGSKYSLITIAGAYDHPDVPRFAVESVVYHEMLHVHIPLYRKNGRNVIHGPAFRKAERAFPHYRRWRKWEHEHMARLVRSLKRKQKRNMRVTL
ncbi:MAG: hypothetical protein GF418_17250 [Chitinivibrionales bacterium]|nr:hypothetical protein [Chitinivibrionales bacterium]MBD3397367.1 hypothetical protein [Chitinivibrionales bacterium]